MRKIIFIQKYFSVIFPLTFNDFLGALKVDIQSLAVYDTINSPGHILNNNDL